MTLLKAQEVDAFVSRPDTARFVVLVCGADAGLVSERVEALTRASVDDARDALAVIRMNGDDLASDPAKLIDEVQAIPMFGGRRAVWVRAGGRNFTAAVETVLALRTNDCRVIIEAGDLKKSAPLRTLCERTANAAVIVCYADTGRDLDRLIDEEMRPAGLTIAPDARAALTPLLGGDRRASRNELRKLALFALGRKRVEVEDVFSVVGDSSALALDDLVDAAFAGRPREIDVVFTKAVTAGVQPGAAIFATLRQLVGLHKARLAIEAGSTPEQELDAMRLHFRRKPAVEAALRAWTSARLTRAMQAVADAQLASRRQAALAQPAIHRLLMSLAQEARRQS